MNKHNFPEHRVDVAADGTRTEVPRQWLAVCLPLLENHSEPHGRTMLVGLAEENDLAERLGFTCELDDRRGHGWCRFRRRDDQHEIIVWESFTHVSSQPELDMSWRRGTRPLADECAFESFGYRNLGDALRAQNPVAKREVGTCTWKPCQEPSNAA